MGKFKWKECKDFWQQCLRAHPAQFKMRLLKIPSSANLNDKTLKNTIFLKKISHKFLFIVSPTRLNLKNGNILTS